jgi:hypothetical protein
MQLHASYTVETVSHASTPTKEQKERWPERMEMTNWETCKRETRSFASWKMETAVDNFSEKLWTLLLSFGVLDSMVCFDGSSLHLEDHQWNWYACCVNSFLHLSLSEITWRNYRSTWPSSRTRFFFWFWSSSSSNFIFTPRFFLIITSISVITTISHICLKTFLCNEKRDSIPDDHHLLHLLEMPTTVFSLVNEKLKRERLETSPFLRLFNRRRTINSHHCNQFYIAFSYFSILRKLLSLFASLSFLDSLIFEWMYQILGERRDDE